MFLMLVGLAVLGATYPKSRAADKCPVNFVIQFFAQDCAIGQLFNLRAVFCRNVPASFPLEDDALGNPKRVGQRGQAALKFNCFS